MGDIGLLGTKILEQTKSICEQINMLSDNEKIEVLNHVKLVLHEVSPMHKEPVDCVLWIDAESVNANDYNPNVVAPPEMRLLEHSIGMDGFTQPIVAWLGEDGYEVVDGFHRNRVGKESQKIKKRLRGYLPLSIINKERQGRNDRIAATIRHNRARGKHQIESMSDIIVELSRRNWSDKRIGKELGMEPDEVLRLKQIAGLAELFADRDFSEAWEFEEEE